MLRDLVYQVRRKENPPQSSFSKGGRKRKRASPALSASKSLSEVEGEVVLEQYDVPEQSRRGRKDYMSRYHKHFRYFANKLGEKFGSMNEVLDQARKLACWRLLSGIQYSFRS